ncbi:AAA family ATPase [Homoserinibacter sp. YIM 151385]|uniref:AAA family ATPase n=1 Tax=Homoserinibacter sp. YIM 151385 TaxID=2985506 RepID=UPI0022F05F9B|nr:AAA family ATPase [Homoserinibacter sp. YIM 151385]WBU37397.1 AAA family ATPase [Homoserinibacter sp. YIM 151385]
MLTAIAVDGYRSLRSLVVPLERLTLVTGANGAGKSSLYRALRLLAAAGEGRIVAALAEEGGLASTLWAGPEGGPRPGVATQGGVRQQPVALRLGVGSDDFGYAIDLGVPQPSRSAFSRDPEIKSEAVWSGPLLRPATLLTERRGPLVRTRGAEGWRDTELRLPPWSSVVAELGDPREAAEVLSVRRSLRAWRFYDALRTDRDAPARTPRVGTRTPVLASDGADLAAALQTIREIGDGDALDAAVADALDGSRLEEVAPVDGRFALRVRQPGMLRPMEAGELSEGTLRFLLLAAALLSPRPAELLVLNEPEGSLHPQLIEPLAAMIGRAAEESQIVVVSHSADLAAGLRRHGAAHHELVKADGETRIADTGPLEGPPWAWPSR